jgi:hypothetical protein
MMRLKMLVTFIAAAFCATANADETLLSTYGSLVDESGNISLPKTSEATGRSSVRGRLPRKMLKPAARLVATEPLDCTLFIPRGKRLTTFARQVNFLMVLSSLRSY